MEYLDRFELYTWRAGRGPAPQSGAALVLGMVGMLALLVYIEHVVQGLGLERGAIALLMLFDVF